MKKVVLLCTLGMSTSLLVSKMRKAAKELGIDCSIVAIGEYELKKYEKEADIIIVKFMGHAGLALATSLSALICTFLLFYSLRKKIDSNIPITLINSADYGTMNGNKILNQALALMDNKELSTNNL